VRWVVVLAAAAVGGCGGDLLPAERVLGDELPAVVVEGATGEGFGAAVAAGTLDGAPVVLVAAPEVGRVDRLDADGRHVESWTGAEGFGRELAIVEGEAYAIDPGVGVRRLRDGVAVAEVADARHVAVCATGEIRATTVDDDDLACGPGGEDLRLSCAEEGCAVSLDGAQLDLVEPGGAVGFDGDRACWGDVMRSDPEGSGRVRCDDGTERVGLAGEHLGTSLASGGDGEALAAGVFDKWIVPARARIHPLSGADVLAIDDADENARLALARGGGLLAVGVADYRRGRDVQGRVFIVAADLVEVAP